MKFISGYVIGCLVMWAIIVLFIVPAKTPPKDPVAPKEYIYNVLLPEGTKLTFRGTEIRGQGLCTEILLNGRLDTRICPSHLITEALPDAPPIKPEGRRM